MTVTDEFETQTPESGDHEKNADDGLKNVVHFIHFANETEPKPRALLAALLLHKVHSALVTCNEASECMLLARYLRHYGFDTECASEENNRSMVAPLLKKVAEGTPLIFICQNNLIDSFDVDTITTLVNYDMVSRPAVYEKIATKGKHERAIINIVSGKDYSFVAPIKSQCGVSFEELTLPSFDEATKMSAERLIKKLNNEASQVELGQFETLTKKLLEESNPTMAVALLLRHYLLRASPPARESEPRERRDSGRHHDRERPRREQRPPEKSEPQSLPAVENQEQHAHHEGSENGITRLYVTLGRQDNFHDLAGLAQFLSEKSGVDLGHFSGSGMIRDTSAHIEVDADVAEKIIQAVNNTPRPHQDPNQEATTIVCEKARQANTRPHFRRGPPHKRGGRFQRR